MTIDDEVVRHQRVPAVELTELQSDAIAVLERHSEQQRRIKLQFQEITAKVLHIIFNYNGDDLTFKVKEIIYKYYVNKCSTL